MATGIGFRRQSGTSGVCKQGPLLTRFVNGSTSDIVAEVLGSNYRARCELFEDFLGDEHVLATGSRFAAHDTSSAGDPTAVSGLQADVANGVYRIGLAADDEAETYGLTFGNQLIIPSNKKFFFETRVSIPVAITTAEVVVLGLGSDVNTTLDSATRNIWFRLQASMALLTEADDNATDTDDQSTGETLSAATWYTLGIDGWDPGKGIRYFLNNKKVDEIVAAALVSSAGNLQPQLLVQKSGGATTPAVDLDYVFLAWDRV